MSTARSRMNHRARTFSRRASPRRISCGGLGAPVPLDYLPPAEFADWLRGFLPQIPATGEAGWLPLGVVTDRTDGKLAHLDGLNISRAWMLEGIASGLPEDDPRRPALRAAADAHRDSGLASVTGEHYEGGHWLGSFATYLVTGKGL